jgi:mono/diheme cytochrome c family protein
MTLSTDRAQQAGGSWQRADMMAQRPLFIHHRSAALLLAACCFLLLAGCQQQMADQPRYKPLARSTFFGDERSARPLVPGTVARGHLNADEAFFTGKSGGKLVDTLPFPISPEVLARGQERFDIFCAPCHGRTGNGDGMVVRRGFRPPPSYHTDRLRQAPVGHFFDVMTKGFGAMPDYVAQVPPRDRWAIVAYIRALQLSQNATLADVPPAERKRLTEGGK